jgi:hypothetical protein
MIEVTAEALATHPFLHNMSRDHLALLAPAAALGYELTGGSPVWSRSDCRRPGSG